MKSLMQCALGENWDKLPPALRAHYCFGKTIDRGCMDIEYPRFMQPYLTLLRLFGALINRGGRQVPVERLCNFLKESVGQPIVAAEIVKCVLGTYI